MDFDTASDFGDAALGDDFCGCGGLTGGFGGGFFFGEGEAATISTPLLSSSPSIIREECVRCGEFLSAAECCVSALLMLLLILPWLLKGARGDK